jgi:hypothetical protein
MKMEKKGLSAVVTALVIILLVLVAVGVVWIVVKDIVERGVTSIDVTSKCLEVDLRAVEVIETSPGNYNVTIERRAGGEEIEGVKLNFFNSTDSSGVIDFGTSIAELETESRDITADIINANKIGYSAYFKDVSGNDAACSQVGEFKF